MCGYVTFCNVGKLLTFVTLASKRVAPHPQVMASLSLTFLADLRRLSFSADTLHDAFDLGQCQGTPGRPVVVGTVNLDLATQAQTGMP